MTPELKKETDRKLDLYRERNKSVIKGQILFTGSSLMEMFPIEDFIKEIGSEYVIYNRGVGGYKTEDLEAALDVCVFELSPARIFINIGTNDLSDPDISISTMIENYDRILTKIKEQLPKVELYLMAYYPVNYDAAPDEVKPGLLIRTNEKINEANREVEKLALKHGARYIDVNDNLKDNAGNLKSEYTIEGIHIKREGYLAILDDVMKYLKE
ncbi:MAG: Lysophospholipase and related esterase [Anaerocolumna sp.]|jgi:lysophospholipase L1-like esterase|nr:Lysophospholipase and related esterase [Anaerocolumna sp.]